MRVLHIDIDTLRADHLGCAGYGRDTSPNIDALAAEGVRFERCYTSDAPCLPSRTALVTGGFGIHTGVAGHGGTAADPALEGRDRLFQSYRSQTSWPWLLRTAGLHTVTISSFAERHSAYHWYAGFNETVNPGFMGLETADRITPLAKDWLERHGGRDDWYLHVHYWDPHSAYRTPASYGDPFADQPYPDWLTEEIRRDHWSRPGPYSAQEIRGWAPQDDPAHPRQPQQADSMDAIRAIYDGYDTGIRYADDHVGVLLNTLADLGVLDDTVVMVSSDHGDSLGELNVYCDHKTADESVGHIPFVLRWPGGLGGAGRVDRGLHYQIDIAATILELLDVEVPETWDGRGFAGAFREARDEGRDDLVISYGVWAVQRAVRWDRYLCIRTYFDGFHDYPPVMLFDLEADPHEVNDLAGDKPELVAQGLARLETWLAEALRRTPGVPDPYWSILAEGGPFELRERLPAYLERLRTTGREQWADRLATAHAKALAPQTMEQRLKGFGSRALPVVGPW